MTECKVTRLIPIMYSFNDYRTDVRRPKINIFVRVPVAAFTSLYECSHYSDGSPKFQQS